MFVTKQLANKLHFGPELINRIRLNNSMLIKSSVNYSCNQEHAAFPYNAVVPKVAWAPTYVTKKPILESTSWLSWRRDHFR